MRAFYEDNHEEYFQTTVAVEPSSFLSPLTAQLAPGATILDVGCGSGRDLRWLTARGYQPTGFELSPGLAGKAREYSQCPVIEGDFTVFDFSTLQYDAVLLTGALVHIPRSDFSSTLINISSALRTHGLLYLSMRPSSTRNPTNPPSPFLISTSRPPPTPAKTIAKKRGKELSGIKDSARPLSPCMNTDALSAEYEC